MIIRLGSMHSLKALYPREQLGNPGNSREITAHEIPRKECHYKRYRKRYRGRPEYASHPVATDDATRPAYQACREDKFESRFGENERRLVDQVQARAG